MTIISSCITNQINSPLLSKGTNPQLLEASNCSIKHTHTGYQEYYDPATNTKSSADPAISSFVNDLKDINKDGECNQIHFKTICEDGEINDNSSQILLQVQLLQAKQHQQTFDEIKIDKNLFEVIKVYDPKPISIQDTGLPPGDAYCLISKMEIKCNKTQFSPTSL